MTKKFIIRIEYREKPGEYDVQKVATTERIVDNLRKLRIGDTFCITRIPSEPLRKRY